MKYETSLVYLEQLPKIAIDTGFDWPTFFSFMATIAVFTIGTWITVRSSNKNYHQQDQILRKTLSSQEKALFLTLNAQEKSLRITNESQEKIARANAVKVSRQAWIDQLRDARSHRPLDPPRRHRDAPASLSEFSFAKSARALGQTIVRRHRWRASRS